MGYKQAEELWEAAAAVGEELRIGSPALARSDARQPPDDRLLAAAFAGVVPALDLTRVETLTLLPPAIAAGTLAWFALVAAAAAYARRLARERVLRAVSFAGGAVIAGLGVLLAVDGVRGI